MVTKNCKKIEPVVVKLRSETKYTTFSEHGVVLCKQKTSSDCVYIYEIIQPTGSIPGWYPVVVVTSPIKLRRFT